MVRLVNSAFGVLLLVQLAAPLQAQRLTPAHRDSLERLLAAAAMDTVRVGLLNDLAFAWRQVDAQRSAELAQEALSLARELGYRRGEGRALNNLGMADYWLNRHAGSIERLRAALAIAEAAPDSELIATVHGNLGLNYMGLDAPTVALDHYQRQLEIAGRIGDTRSAFRAENNIGLLYRRVENEAEAMVHLRRAFAMAEHMADRAMMASVLSNMAVGLRKQGQLDSTQAYYEQALALNKATGSDRFRATNHLGLAQLFLETGQPQRAKAHADTALAIREGMGNRSEMAMAHGILSGIMQGMGDQKEALRHIERAEQLAAEAGDRQHRIEAMQALAGQLADMGRYKESSLWFGRHVALRDSVDKENAAAKLANQQVAFDVARKDARIADLAGQEQRQREQAALREEQRDRWMLIAGALLLLIAMGLWQYVRIRRLNKALALARDRAERNERSMDHFLAIMGHEVRSPMAAAIASLDMAMGQAVPEARDRYLSIAARSMRNLLRIVNDLVDRSAIEAGVLRITPAPFVPERMLNETAAPFAALCEGRGLAFRMEMGGSLSSPRLGDAGRIGQILANLLGNAVKYTAKGEVRLSAAILPDDQLVIEVSDSGPGMDAAQQARLFAPFQRPIEGAAQDPGGTGLGLYIAASLARIMNGSLTVTSAPGGGSTFRLALPLPPAPVVTPARSSSTATDHFIVDDDANARDELARTLLLIEPDARIHTMEHGAALLARLESNAPEPQGAAVVYTDLDMPGMNGFELLQRMKQGSHRGVPVIATTGSLLMFDEEEMRDLGFAAVVRKPVNAQALRHALLQVSPMAL